MSGEKSLADLLRDQFNKFDDGRVKVSGMETESVVKTWAENLKRFDDALGKLEKIFGPEVVKQCLLCIFPDLAHAKGEREFRQSVLAIIRSTSQNTDKPRTWRTTLGLSEEVLGNG